MRVCSDWGVFQLVPSTLNSYPGVCRLNEPTEGCYPWRPNASVTREMR